MDHSTDEIIDSEMWEFELPVWVLANRDNSTVVLIDKEENENYIPIFTDVDLAERFIEDAPLPGKKPLKLDDAKSLLAVLRNVQKNAKCKNVGIDVTCKPQITGHFWPITYAIDPLEDAK